VTSTAAEDVARDSFEERRAGSEEGGGGAAAEAVVAASLWPSEMAIFVL
jgi:hypothetical protein